MTEIYKIGDRVRVEFECVVTDADSTFLKRFGHSVEVRRDNGYGHSVRPEDVKEVLGPANWPPQGGDIWEAEGIEYAIDASGYVLDLAGGGNDYGACDEDFKALNPVLVRRKGQEKDYDDDKV